jgi:hypothetical protein
VTIENVHNITHELLEGGDCGLPDEDIEGWQGDLGRVLTGPSTLPLRLTRTGRFVLILPVFVSPTFVLVLLVIVPAAVAVWVGVGGGDAAAAASGGAHGGSGHFLFRTSGATLEFLLIS